MAVIQPVPDSELERHWAANDMDAKRRTGLLTEIIAAEKPSAAIPGIRVKYIKLLTAKGQHIATVRDMIDSTGRVLETQIRDYTCRNCERIRRFHSAERQ